MNNALDIVTNLKNVKVLIVGDVMLDEYVWGNVHRISPEAPIPILDVKEITYTPGGAANTAHNARALGDKVVLVGVVGPDEKGGILKETLEGRGINARGLIIDESRKTTVKTRVVASSQQLVRIDTETRSPINPKVEDEILTFVKAHIGETNVVIISDYAKGVVTPSLSGNVVALARQNNVLCFVDPKGDDYLKYKNCAMVTPNLKELAQALHIPLEQIENENNLLQAGKMLLSHVMCDNVLLTRGGEGIHLFEKDGNVSHFPAINKNAIDVSGAGDTLIAASAMAIAAGASVQQAMRIASHACGIVVGKRGTAVALPEELEKSLESDPLYA